MNATLLKWILTTFIFFAYTCSNAQQIHNYKEVLNQILINNENIKVAKFKYEAELKNNKSNVFDDPIAINYSLNPKDHEYNIRQGFYFPTVYFQKDKYSKELSSKAELELLLAVREVVDKLNIAFIESLFYIKMKRFKEEIYIFTDGFLESQDSLIADSPIELKRVRLAILDYRTNNHNFYRELEMKNNLLKELNGGIPIEVVVGDVSHIPIPIGEYNAQEIVKNSLELKMADINYNIKKRAVSLSNQNWIPKLSLGYTLTNNIDNVPSGHKLQVGVIIPVWNNAAKVTVAKLNLLSSNHLKTATEIEMNNKINNLILKYKSYRVLLGDYEQFFPKNYLVELKTLLDSDSIDVFSFFQEVASYQDAYFNYCLVEKELFLIINEISKYEYPNQVNL